MVDIDVSGAGASFSTSAGLAGIVSDETGTGALVLATSPTLVTPVLGAATATSLAIANGAVTSSSPALTVTQTWNNGAVAFEAVTIDVTDTAAASGASYFTIKRNGAVIFAVRDEGTGAAIRLGPNSAGNPIFSKAAAMATCIVSGTHDGSAYAGLGGEVLHAAKVGGAAIRISSTGTLSWVDAPGAADSLNVDLSVARDAANVLAQRRGTNAQTSRLYYSYTDTSNYARLAFSTGASAMTIACETAGTGADNIDLALAPVGTGNVSFPGGTLLKTTAALTNGAAAAAGTLLNAPAAGDPTKWIPINDNGTVRYIPAW